MSEKSSFFNAQLVEEEYDRTYDAEDFSEYFSTFIRNGVMYNTSQPLQVVFDSGFNVIVKKGVAFIDGHRYELTEDKTITLTSNTSGETKYSVVAVTLSQNDRNIVTKERANATSLLPINDGVTHELVLATIEIAAGASTLSQSVITDRRSDNNYCGWIAQLIEELDTTELFAQFTASYNEWFAELKAKFADEDVAKLQASIDDKWKEIYPVGSVYISTDETSPEELFGGEWEEYGTEDSYVRLGGSGSGGQNSVSYTPSGSVGGHSHYYTPSGSNSGGSVQSHTLTLKEIPPHNHQMFYGYGEEAPLTHVFLNDTAYNSTLPTYTYNSGGGQGHNHGFTNPTFSGSRGQTESTTPTFTGTKATISVEPKYVQVYAWKRIA